MFEIFASHINANKNFTQEELTLVRSLSITKKLRRKQLLLHEGEVCKYKTFVIKGLLRTYRLRNDGTEVVMRFAPENWWCVDPESYNTQEPSKYNIEALEDTDVIMWTHDDLGQLLKTIPALKDLVEKLMERTISETQKRILMNISYTAEEKYDEFVNTYPDVFRRVPLHMVASYLGVSRETLSRVRHAQQKRL